MKKERLKFNTAEDLLHYLQETFKSDNDEKRAYEI